MGSDSEAPRRQFSEYFAARHDTVRRTAYLICGDWHWADDLTQTAFIKLSAAWHRVRDPHALDAFVRTCLMRAYLSELRKVWRRRERPFAELPETAGEHDEAENASRRVTFARALRQLPPRQRVTLICRYYQGLDVAQTAAALGCSEGTVKSQTARGLAALRRMLGESAFLPPDDKSGQAAVAPVAATPFHGWHPAGTRAPASRDAGPRRETAQPSATAPAREGRQ